VKFIQLTLAVTPGWAEHAAVEGEGLHLVDGNLSVGTIHIRDEAAVGFVLGDVGLKWLGVCGDTTRARHHVPKQVDQKH
jgi:hypothetical protein